MALEAREKRKKANKVIKKYSLSNRLREKRSGTKTKTFLTHC